MTQTAIRKQQQNGYALMVHQLDWTTAPIVKLTFSQEWTIEAKTIDTRNRKIVADASVYVPAGTTLYLVESDDLPCWYYIARVDHGHVSCSCPSGQVRHTCKHGPRVMAFINKPKPAATPAVKWDEGDEVQHIEDSIASGELDPYADERAEWAKMTPDERRQSFVETFHIYDEVA